MNTLKVLLFGETIVASERGSKSTSFARQTGMQGKAVSSVTAMCTAVILFNAAAGGLAQEAYPITTPTHAVCGQCCHKGTYCEPTVTTTTLATAAGGLMADHVFPEGTSMTCYLRDRDQPGAVDGGLCIPSTGVPDITTFCSDMADSPESRVVPTVYEAGLEEQEHICSPCCDGQHVCGYGLKCARVVDHEIGVCIPEAEDSPNFCQGFAVSSSTLSCERCDAYTPVARQLRSVVQQLQQPRRALAQADSSAGASSSGGGSQLSSSASAGASASAGGSTASANSDTSSRRTPAPTPARTPAPTPARTPAPTAARTPAPTAAATPAPTIARTPAPTAAATPAPTNRQTPFQKNFPPIQNYFPPVQNRFPPIQNYFPPVQNHFPPVQSYFPPFQNHFPPKPSPGTPPAPGPKLG